MRDLARLASVVHTHLDHGAFWAMTRWMVGPRAALEATRSPEPGVKDLTAILAALVVAATPARLATCPARTSRLTTPAAALPVATEPTRRHERLGPGC